MSEDVQIANPEQAKELLVKIARRCAQAILHPEVALPPNVSVLVAVGAQALDAQGESHRVVASAGNATGVVREEMIRILAWRYGNGQADGDK